MCKALCRARWGKGLVLLQVWERSCVGGKVLCRTRWGKGLGLVQEWERSCVGGKALCRTRWGKGLVYDVFYNNDSHHDMDKTQGGLKRAA